MNLSAQQEKPIDSLTRSLIESKGMISTFISDDKDKLLLQIHDTLLGKPLLMVSRYVKLPSNYSAYSNAGSKTAEQIIQFEKLGGRILLKQASFINEARIEDPIHESVISNNFFPILASFEKMNLEEELHLFDATSYFSEDSPGFNVVGETQKKAYKMGGLDKKRSFINTAKSFPKNTEITHTLTYPSAEPPRGNRSETLSFQMNHSIIALPENPMPVRYADSRVGWFTLEKYNYSSEALKSDNYRIAVRWRLEPKDVKAYQRGELVEPKKPIVFYIDPATPLKWRPYFKQGIEDWNPVFEKAGFKNAILAKDPPSQEEDPAFSPEDVRYSVVRYVASTTRNATGPSVKDPRTGEILESDVIWYHNHLRSYRNRYLLETAAANPKARSLDTPEEEIGEMMRRVIAHEVGHAIGLPHNMKASAAYPVDSLRSGSFTQKMGIAATIMDYARYNYVAQPSDKNIRFVRQMGPYDDYSVEWGYRYFPGKSPVEIKSILEEFVDEHNLDPLYQFGYSGTDPNAQTENIGDDPIKATQYGLKNLRVVAENLESWTTPMGTDFEDLRELYLEMVGVYRRYIYHVASVVGGVYNTSIHRGQADYAFENVPEHEQLRALDLLYKEVFTAPEWLLDPSLLSKIDEDGKLDLIQNLQKALIYRLLEPKKLNETLSRTQTLVGEGLSPSDLINTLNELILNRLDPHKAMHRTLQTNLVLRYIELYKDTSLETEIKSHLHRLLLDNQKSLKGKSRAGNNKIKTHFMYLQNVIESAID